MSIMHLQDLGQSFGAFDLFSDITARIEDDNKIGLVGPNGIGKTSLLLILAGLAEPADGKIHRHRDLQIGYLRQESSDAFIGKENTVYEEMLNVFSGVQAMEDQLRTLEDRMAADASEVVLEEYGALQTEFERIGGYDYELRIAQTLTGLGFSDADFALPLMHLSGGQKTRALLARLLLERPNLLILDEPTNHLDMEAIRWLEKALAEWRGALLIVSHDRYFLDRAVNTIWEMTRGGIETYPGNYSAYLRQRTERWDYMQKVYDQELERLNKEMDFIKRNIARDSTRNLAYGRLRRLSRDLVAIEEIGLIAYKNSRKWSELGIGGVRPMGVMEAEAAIKAISMPSRRPPQAKVRLRAARRSGEKVFGARQLGIGYAQDAKLFTIEDEVKLFRGDCAALIGPNGTGKSTLLKTIMGEIESLHGWMHLGMNVRVGYFAQAHDDMQPENQVIDELMRHRTMTLSQARQYLAPYLFRGEDVFKQIKMLSGGERARLALAILGLDGANFLLLDEPTNHLDIPTQEMLQEVLETFNGTILLVSHDRYLIDRLATQIWSLEDGQLTVFDGGYQEYVDMREAEKQQAKSERKAQRRAQRTSTRVNGTNSREIEKLEAQIFAVEGELAELGRLLQSAGESSASEEIRRLGEAYAHSQEKLDNLMARWTIAADE